MKKVLDSVNGNLKWIVSTILMLLFALLGGWAQDTRTEIKAQAAKLDSHAAQIFELKKENAVVQTKLDLLLSAHGIEFVDEKNLVLRGKRQ